MYPKERQTAVNVRVKTANVGFKCGFLVSFGQIYSYSLKSKIRMPQRKK